jgi:hypothetical protein
MKRMLLALIILCLAAASPSGFTQSDDTTSPLAGAAAGSTPANPWADGAQATALVRGYLEREKLDWTVETTGEFPVYTATVKMTNATHHPRIVIDTKRLMVYVFLNRYLTAKPDSPQLPQVLQRLMEENWNLNVGKFEWDKTDGEIRFSFMFTTENGLGYEAFDAIMDTLLQTGDRLWPELRALTGD